MQPAAQYVLSPVERLCEAWLHNRNRTLMGIRVAPFCFAHHLLLRYFESPLPYRPAAASPMDFAVAVTLCACKDWDEVDAIDGCRPTLRARWCAGQVANDPRALEALRAAWAAYMGDYATWPELVEKHTGSTTTPFELSMVVAVAKAFAVDPERVWFWPAGKVAYYCHAINEGKHGSEFITDEDHERDSRLRAKGILPPQGDELDDKGNLVGAVPGAGGEQ